MPKCVEGVVVACPAACMAVYLAYVGAVVLAAGVLVLGIGLVRRPAQ